MLEKLEIILTIAVYMLRHPKILLAYLLLLWEGDKIKINLK